MPAIVVNDMALQTVMLLMSPTTPQSAEQGTCPGLENLVVIAVGAVNKVVCVQKVMLPNCFRDRDDAGLRLRRLADQT